MTRAAGGVLLGYPWNQSGGEGGRMKGDVTPSTFRLEKHYGSVGTQQGRVQLDDDLNEHAGLAAGLDRITRVDVIGRCEFPRAAAGFGIGITPDGLDLTLSPGRGYVGLLCECRATPIRVEELDEGRAVLQDVVTDGRHLVAGEWVELWASDVHPHLIRVLDLNVYQRSIRFAPKLGARELDTLKVSKTTRARPRLPTSRSRTFRAWPPKR